MDQLCNDKVRRNPAFNLGGQDLGGQEESAAWRYCVPVLNAFCALSDEMSTTTHQLNTALAFCVIGAVAVIAGEVSLLFKQQRDAKKSINELLQQRDYDKVKNLCDKLKINCDANSKPNAIISCLEIEKDRLRWPARKIAFLMGSKAQHVASAQTPIYRFFNGFQPTDPGDRNKDITKLIFDYAGMMPKRK